MHGSHKVNHEEKNLRYEVRDIKKMQYKDIMIKMRL